jgi:hypothetical protein
MPPPLAEFVEDAHQSSLPQPRGRRSFGRVVRHVDAVRRDPDRLQAAL